MVKNNVLISLSVALAISFSLTFLPFAYAVGNIHIGDIEIHPVASIEEKYDDNIFLETNNQEDDDWITSAILGVNLEKTIAPERMDDFLFNLNYAASFIEFSDHTDQNRADHNLTALADFKFSNDFTLKLEDGLQKTADPPNSEITGLEKRLRNSANLVLGYMREKIGFDAGYRNTRDDYNVLSNLDRYTHEYTATGYYQVFPKTSFFGEYNYGKIIYDDSATNSDSNYNQFRLGVRGQIAPKLTGVAKAGYKKTNYKTSGKKDFKGFASFVNVTYELQERTSLNIYAERSSEESAYSTNSYFEYNQLGLKIDHKLLENLSLISGGYYQLNKYPDETTESSVTAKRKDQLWDGNVGLLYKMKDWISLQTDYEYKQRESEFDNFDYKNNKVTAKVNLVF